mgnify:CR=1 FL=1
MYQKYRYYARMSKLEGRLKREHQTLVCMTRIYCEHHHRGHPDVDLCPECSQLMQYAGKRLEKCPYGTSKPTCAKCPIHCYKPAQREAAREVMRFAGPKMPWRHPLQSIIHMLDKLRKVKHPMELRRTAKTKRPGN